MRQCFTYPEIFGYPLNIASISSADKSLNSDAAITHIPFPPNIFAIMPSSYMMRINLCRRRDSLHKEPFSIFHTPHYPPNIASISSADKPLNSDAAITRMPFSSSIFAVTPSSCALRINLRRRRDSLHKELFSIFHTPHYPPNLASISSADKPLNSDAAITHMPFSPNIFAVTPPSCAL
jgi:hypothetical protein